MIVGMELGTWEQVEDDSADRFESLRRAARQALDAGLSLLSPPPQRWIGDRGSLQPIQLMAALAALDTGMAASTGPLLAALSNPVELAEQIVTLQIALGGQLIVELRPWAATEETEPFGIEASEVMERTVEAVGLFAELWTEDEVDHSGAFYRVPGARPTLRPPGRRLPQICLLARDREEAMTAARLGVGLSVDARTTPPDLIRSWHALPGEGTDRPLLCRRDVESCEGLLTDLDEWYEIGVTHLLLRPRALSERDVAALLDEAGPIVAGWRRARLGSIRMQGGSRGGEEG